MNRLDRRTFLTGVAVGTVGAIAGCLGSTDPGSVGAGSMDDELPPPIRGDSDASVTLTSFVDYGCPHCATFETEIMPTIVEDYIDPGDVRQLHRDYPIPANQQWSGPMANAARSVQDTTGDEAFWTFTTRIFEYQGSYSNDLIAEIAEEAGADPDAAVTAAEEGKYDDRVTADIDLGDDAGVRGTPAVFVDGDQLDGYQAETVRSAIEDRL